MNSLSQTPGSDMEFNVHDESFPHSVTYFWSYKLNGTVAGCSVRTLATSTRYVLNCANAGNLTVSVRIMDGQNQIKIEDYFAKLNDGTPVGSLKASYTIPMGTGTNSWNAANAPVEVFVGQTLTITNADTMNHQLHTGGKPCGHGSAFASGGKFDCVISAAYNPATDGAIYDHNVGSSARFYLIAHDGAQLYNTNCMSCHGALSSSQKRNATAASIQGAISSVADMKSRAGLTGLSPKQIEAIAYMLSK
ncbi:MAG: hypothetical protein ACXWC9_11415, partial [Pseudobdellovibrionaceae bacterium]